MDFQHRPQTGNPCQRYVDCRNGRCITIMHDGYRVADGFGYFGIYVYTDSGIEIDCEWRQNSDNQFVLTNLLTKLTPELRRLIVDAINDFLTCSKSSLAHYHVGVIMRKTISALQ